MSLVDLKAKMYDLMAAKQQIEQQMQQVNQLIIAEMSPKAVEPKEEPKAE